MNTDIAIVKFGPEAQVEPEGKMTKMLNDKNSYMIDDASPAEHPRPPQISPWPTRRNEAGYHSPA
jgi:hypothetical protein